VVVADETSGFVYARPALILQLSAVTQSLTVPKGFWEIPLRSCSDTQRKANTHTTSSAVNTLWAGLWRAGYSFKVGTSPHVCSENTQTDWRGRGSHL